MNILNIGDYIGESQIIKIEKHTQKSGNKKKIYL